MGDYDIIPAHVHTTKRETLDLVSARTSYKFAAYRAAASGLKLKVPPMGPVGNTSRSVRRIRISSIRKGCGTN
jgi:hypothetical protein